jgi:hypothetical protein
MADYLFTHTSLVWSQGHQMKSLYFWHTEAATLLQLIGIWLSITPVMSVPFRSFQRQMTGMA